MAIRDQATYIDSCLENNYSSQLKSWTKGQKHHTDSSQKQEGGSQFLGSNNNLLQNLGRARASAFLSETVWCLSRHWWLRVYSKQNKLQVKNFRRDKEDDYIRIRGSAHQGAITIIDTHVPNINVLNLGSTYGQNWRENQTTGDSDAPLSRTDSTNNTRPSEPNWHIKNTLPYHSIQSSQVHTERCPG